MEVSGEGGLKSVSVQIETPDPRAAQRLEEALHQAFGLRFGVTAVGGLPRFEAKAQRWVATK